MSGPRRVGSQHPRPRDGEAGAVAVEFALVIPVLAMLVMGILTAGISYSNGVGLSNAVREGSRFAASTSALTASNTFDWSTWTDSVFERTRELQFDDPSAATTICVRVMYNSSDDPNVPANLIHEDCDAGTAPIGPAPAFPEIGGKHCAVVVWATRKFEVNALIANFDSVMERQSIARYERTCT